MSLKGHPIRVVERHRTEVDGRDDLLSDLFSAETSIVLIRDVFPKAVMASAVQNLAAPALHKQWVSPNQGMVGGEIRTVGAAATPTFTSFSGPSVTDYRASQRTHAAFTQSVFDQTSPTTVVSELFSDLYAGRPAHPATFASGEPWLPYNYRALDQGQQIYPHHDNHYRLSIYEGFDAHLDRTVILSWFTLLQPAERGGDLIVYGLWGSDPDPPMLPTRFLDTRVLERDYRRFTVPMQSGDVVIFNSGCHVHRVSEVETQQSRMTMGGFATVDVARSHLAFWS